MTRSQLNKNVFSYLINAINLEGYGVEFKHEANTDKEKIEFVVNCFKKEFWHDANKLYYKNNIATGFANWLMGLPSVINIDFYYSDILELAKKWECIPKNATEKQEDTICENWFNWITNKFFQLASKHKIEIYHI